MTKDEKNRSNDVNSTCGGKLADSSQHMTEGSTGALNANDSSWNGQPLDCESIEMRLGNESSISKFSMEMAQKIVWEAALESRAFHV